MVNRTGQGSPIQGIDRNTGVAGGVTQVRYSTTSAAARNAGEPMEALARNFSAVSSRLENRLDVMAADEGQAAGMAAGAREDVQLRRDATIRGRSFDAAASRSMIARHDTQGRISADEIYQTHKDNPAALEKELAKYKNGIQTSNLPEEVKTDFGLSFDRVSAAYISDAKGRQERLQIDADRASALSNIEARRKSIEKLAILSENDQQAAVAMAQEIEDMKGFVLRQGPKGAFEFDGVEYPADPTRAGAYGVEDIQKLVMSTADSAREARVIGKFIQAQGLGEKGNILRAFDAEFSSGESDFDLDQYDRLRGRMRAEINRIEADQNGRAAGVSKQIKTATSMIEKGFNPGDDVLENLEVQASLSGDPNAVAEVREARSLMTFQDQARQLRPDQLQSVINEGYAALNEKGARATPQAIKRMELAEKLLSNMTTEINRDPLSWANRTGVVALEPISFDDPESLQKRGKAADTVSTYYNIRPPLMTDEEIDAFKAGWDQAPADQRAGMIATIQDGFGDDAIYAFEDLSKVSSSLANIGGLLAQNPAHGTTARDFAAGDAAIAGGAKLLSDNGQVRSVQGDALGNAYGFAAGAQAAVLDTAEKIYTAKALRQGLTRDDFDKDLYEKSLQEAAGRWSDRNGNTYGGIVTQKRGHKIILPPDMTQDMFEATIDGMTETQLVKASVGYGVGLHQNDEIFDLDDLKKSYLISSGPGRYVISTTNPAKGPPTFVQSPTQPDGVFEIDLMKMRGKR